MKSAQSVYADIALSLGDYLHGRYWLDVQDYGVVVSDMVIEKALIAAPSGPQLLRTTVDLDSKEKTAKCRFSTVEVRHPSNFSVGEVEFC